MVSILYCEKKLLEVIIKEVFIFLLVFGLGGFFFFGGHFYLLIKVLHKTRNYLLIKTVRN